MKLLILCLITLAFIPASYAQTPPVKTVPQDESASNGRMWIHLVDGRRIEVTEITESATGIWYRRGQVSAFLDRSQFTRIEREDTIVPHLHATESDAGSPAWQVKKLPVNFSGINPANVYLALNRQRKALAKNQFETSDEYKARVQRLLRTIQADGATKASDDLIFTLTDREETYDADGRFYSVKIDTNSVVMRSADKSLGSAVGQNAFGVKKRYTIKQFTFLKLVMPDYRVSWSGMGITIPGVAPAKARQMMGNVCIALRGRLMAPFVSSDSDEENATLTSPEEAHNFYFNLFFEPKSLVLFHRQTGEVYGTLEVSNFPKREYTLPGSLTVGTPRKVDSTEAPSGPGRSLSTTDSPGTNSSINRKAQIISKPEPLYPEIARKHRVAGTVRLRVSLNPNGTVDVLRVVAGLPDGVTESAIEAVKKMTFTPAVKDGQPVPQTVTIEYNFNIF